MIIVKNYEETEDQSSIKLIDPHPYSNQWAQHNVLFCSAVHFET